MHTCRLKAGFPTIFELMSSKREGYNKLFVFKDQICYPSKKTFFVYTCRLKAAFHTKFVTF